MATLALLQYPQGDKLVLLNGTLIYAEDPQDRRCHNGCYGADFVARQAAQALGLSEPHTIAVPAEIADSEADQYENAVQWYNEQAQQRDPRLDAIVEKLFKLAESSEEVQFAVDDLVYDHIGTGKHASSINNQGFSGQADALVERMGLEDTLAELNGIVDDFTKDATAAREES
jgi:hypothetical protein